MLDTGWMPVGDSPTVRTFVRLTDCPDGSQDIEIIQQAVGVEEFLDQLKAERDAAEKNGWRDGAIIGRVPDAYYHTSGLAQARYQQDKSWLARFWNDSDHRNLRVKQGRV